jgi:hypothetical protein
MAREFAQRAFAQRGKKFEGFTLRLFRGQPTVILPVIESWDGPWQQKDRLEGVDISQEGPKTTPGCTKRGNGSACALARSLR